MTESEALKRMKMLIGISPSESILESFKLVSEALEEVEQYRAIGTVEELQKMKDDYAEAITDWRQYKKIGTIERFRELTEKAEPKKPLNIRPNAMLFDCPRCGRTQKILYQGFHCKECGQRLDWE